MLCTWTTKTQTLKKRQCKVKIWQVYFLGKKAMISVWCELSQEPFGLLANSTMSRNAFISEPERHRGSRKTSRSKGNSQDVKSYCSCIIVLHTEYDTHRHVKIKILIYTHTHTQRCGLYGLWLWFHFPPLTIKTGQNIPSRVSFHIPPNGKLGKSSTQSGNLSKGIC